jgi:hypothetical protein
VNESALQRDLAPANLRTTLQRKLLLAPWVMSTVTAVELGIMTRVIVWYQHAPIRDAGSTVLWFPYVACHIFKPVYARRYLGRPGLLVNLVVTSTFSWMVFHRVCPGAWPGEYGQTLSSAMFSLFVYLVGILLVVSAARRNW